MSPRLRPVRGDVSPPLPLPVNFTLIPSLLPTRSLVPLLYSTVNGLPVYLTLLPTHPPHVSFLPLLIALFPASPIHLIKLLHSAGSAGYSRDLQGNAPFVDIWVPLPRAKELCEALGVGRLFWDEKREKAGLMGREVEGMISWEEEGGVCHNWLPSANSIPTSSYSLDRLLSTPFGGIDIIPDDRYILTVCDPARKARIARESELEDHSRIRGGEWARAWDGYLKLAGEVWAGYLAYPSKPPKHSPLPPGLTLADAQLIDLYSSITNTLVSASSSAHTTHSLPHPSHTNTAGTSTSSSLAYPLTSADILSSLAAPPAPSFLSLLLDLVSRLYIAFLCLPLIRLTPIGIPLSQRAYYIGRNKEGKVDPEEVKRRCRIQLSLVELIGALMVDKMATQLEIERLGRQVQGLDEEGAGQGKREVRIVLEGLSKVEELYGRDPGRSALSPPVAATAQLPSATKHTATAQAGKYARAADGARSARAIAEAKNGGRLETTNGRSTYHHPRTTAVHSGSARVHQRVYSIDETGSDTGSSDFDPDGTVIKSATGRQRPREEDEMKRLERQRGGSPTSSTPPSIVHVDAQQADGSGDDDDSVEDDDMTPTGHARHRGADRLGKGTQNAGGRARKGGSKFSFGKATKRAEERDGDIWDPPSDDTATPDTARQPPSSSAGMRLQPKSSQDRNMRRPSIDKERRHWAAEVADPAHERDTMATAPMDGQVRRRSSGSSTTRKVTVGPDGKLGAVFEDDDNEYDDDDEHHGDARHGQAREPQTQDKQLRGASNNGSRRADDTGAEDEDGTIGSLAQDVVASARDTIATTAQKLNLDVNNEDLQALLRPMIMRSERLEHVWMYYGMVLAAGLAVLLGWMPIA